MSLLAQQVADLCRLSEKKGNNGTVIARQDGEARKAQILAVIEKYGPCGETEISKHTGILRTCVHNHLLDLEAMRKIKRASDKSRAPWVVCQLTPGHLVSFLTKEDEE